jgi:hypothetical protein
MDVRDMKYGDNSFDLAIDKSTIDALLCGDSSFLNVAIMTKEVQRILKTGGIYMIISYGQPENRVFHLEREHLSFDINIFTIKKDTNDPDIGEKEKVRFCLNRFIMFMFVRRNLMLIKSAKKILLQFTMNWKNRSCLKRR